MILIGAFLLVISTFISWYSLTITGSTSVILSFSLYGQASATANGVTISGSYAQAHLNSVGGLYGGVLGLLVVSILIAFFAGIASIVTAYNPERRRLAVALGSLALLLALLGPIDVATNQSHALASDWLGATNGQASQSSANGPWNSFAGSISQSGVSISWGPSGGWYLALFAAFLVLVGTIQTLRARFPVEEPLPGYPVDRPFAEPRTASSVFPPLRPVSCASLSRRRAHLVRRRRVPGGRFRREAPRGSSIQPHRCLPMPLVRPAIRDVG